MCFLRLVSVYSLFDVINEIVGIIAVELDVMLLAEVIHRVGNLCACV